MSNIEVAEDSPNDDSQPLLLEEERNNVADYHSLSATDLDKRHGEETKKCSESDDLEPPGSLSFELSRDDGRIKMEGEACGLLTKVKVGYIFVCSVYIAYGLSFFQSSNLYTGSCLGGECTYVNIGDYTTFYYTVFVPTFACAWLLAFYVVFCEREKVTLSKDAIEIKRTNFCRISFCRIPLNEVRTIKESLRFGVRGADVVTLGRRYKLKSTSNDAEQAFLAKYLTNFVEKHRGPMKFPAHENLLNNIPGSRKIKTLRGKDDLLSVPPSDSRVKWDENLQCFVTGSQELLYGELVFWLVLSVLAAELICWLYMVFIAQKIRKGTFHEADAFVRRVAIGAAFAVAIPIYILIMKVALMWQNSIAETRWLIGGDTVSQCTSGFRRPYRQDWKISSVNETELRWMGPGTRTADCQYQLRLIGPANQEKRDINGLTEGEARWIASKIKNLQDCVANAS